MDIKGVEVISLTLNTDHRGWLMEAYRKDQTNILPEMAYISSTMPGIIRGPHEHLYQTDMFIFIQSNWRVKLWDNDIHSCTYGNVMDFIITCPTKVIVPPMVVHAYQNWGETPQLVINLPDRLYKGQKKREEVDEIRHENGTRFVMGNIK